jgi:hypothetical protein
MQKVPVACLLIQSLLLANTAQAQTMRMGEVLIVNTPVLKDVAEVNRLESLVTGEAAIAWKKNTPGITPLLLRADRGDRKGDYLLIWVADSRARREAAMPLSGKALFSKEALAGLGAHSTAFSTLLGKTAEYAEYELIGADQIGQLPAFGILGIHFIKVRPDKAEVFERFVCNSLYPAMADRTPGMRLLYYKGTRGKKAGSYLAIFVIQSVHTREQYWPTDSPETELLKSAFKPLKPLALELSKYLVEGSYLEGSSGAAAAYFESLEWIDFARIEP